MQGRKSMKGSVCCISSTHKAHWPSRWPMTYVFVLRKCCHEIPVYWNMPAVNSIASFRSLKKWFAWTFQRENKNLFKSVYHQPSVWASARRYIMQTRLLAQTAELHMLQAGSRRHMKGNRGKREEEDEQRELTTPTWDERRRLVMATHPVWRSLQCRWRTICHVWSETICFQKPQGVG